MTLGQTGRVTVDVNEHRQRIIALNGLVNANRAYTIYYDETNNIRRLHVRDDGLNVREPKCFVVGGVAHEGSGQQIDLGPLRSSLKVQPSAAEIKLKHVATGNFLDILGAARLEIFLEWLIAQGLFVHYSVVDPLYWSIVDVVDSILGQYGESRLFGIARPLKNDLYKILRYDYDGTVDIFQRYTYPDVGRANREAFLEELIELAEVRSDLLDHTNYMMLKGTLEIGLKLDSLPFLENEAPNVLIDSFGAFFQERICLLKNAAHILDLEDVIKDYLGRLRFVDGDRELANFRFAVSHDEPGIQVSDVITSLLGKYFSFICAGTDEALWDARSTLNAQQTRNITLLNDLLERSVGENLVFSYSVISIRDQMFGEAFRSPME
ncbi:MULTISPECIES: DUF3800 domain-containing protein [unclassified Rhizobium]|uniref:DUF3800 domain-containing protein n=1 Tax=unclassified Rhizobium TaxID=2613769 RepID=UPI001AE2A03F|nr:MULTISPECIES: DUF3800 domain-containing protein [unclassified Rhizobium]MBP2463937.1 hypothetical protein [Rhizobium sp. PvP014]MBP2532303.1 hypothetical protein [Rhizobium sp. PvP099]